ncbi:YafY family protein [Paenibacillus azoreducens]|uniref:DNA-binding transcriptional regulator n=2 Tax=Paenibacillus azoreducens TaxID=116718 RepID=A0A919YMW6_9BACL|nr:DNA-binding transcriptional regulator [Paenibacillus azoreducens]
MMSKADNMLSILWMLRSGKKMTAQQLSDELEIHVRTVYRCIDSLCASGAPIIADSGPNGGFQIMGEFAESPLLFDTEEQKALVHASVFAKEAGYPFTDALNRAIDKLKRYTNEKQLHQLERHSSGISVLHPPIDGQQKSFLQMLEGAIASGQTLKMNYAKGRDGTVITRDFDPYGIVHWKGQWYTVGYCRLRREMRNFRVDRITQLELTDQHFERPEDFSAKGVLLNQLLPDTLLDDSLVTVRVQGHEHVLNELRQHWLFGHALTDQSPGEAVFRLEPSSLQAFVPYFLLPYGKALTILEPDMLVMKMAEVSAGIAEHYRNMLSKSITPKGDRQ